MLNAKIEIEGDTATVGPIRADDMSHLGVPSYGGPNRPASGLGSAQPVGPRGPVGVDSAGPPVDFRLQDPDTRGYPAVFLAHRGDARGLEYQTRFARKERPEFSP
ncbi:MAG: hypothetical protein ACLQGP_34125 [Isosphaeraceae bacterium]